LRESKAAPSEKLRTSSEEKLIVDAVAEEISDIEIEGDDRRDSIKLDVRELRRKVGGRGN